MIVGFRLITFSSLRLQASGVAVEDCCKLTFQDLKLGHKYRYVIFRLSADYKAITVDKTADPSKSTTLLVAKLGPLPLA